MSETLTDKTEDTSALPPNAEEAVATLEAVSELPPKKKRGCLKWILFSCLGLFTALILGLVLVVGFCLGPIGKAVVDKKGAELLGVDHCSVESLIIHPFSGYVCVENLRIGKPANPGANFSRDLLNLEYFEFKFDVFTALSQKKIIDRIVLKNLYLTYEKPPSGPSNVKILADRFASQETETPESAPEEKEEESTREEEAPIYLAARYVDISNINVNAVFSGVPSPIPPVSFKFEKGIGLDEDLTPLQFGLRFAGNFVSVFRILHGTILGDALGTTVGAISGFADLTSSAVSDAAKLTTTVVSDAAGLTANAVTDAAHVTGDAVEATVGAVTDVSDAILGIFSSKKDKDEKEDKKNEDEENKKK